MTTVAEVAISESGEITNQEVRRIFNLLDTQDIEGFDEHLTDNVEVRFGNGPAMVGRPAVAEGQKGFFAALSKMEHKI